MACLRLIEIHVVNFDQLATCIVTCEHRSIIIVFPYFAPSFFYYSVKNVILTWISCFELSAQGCVWPLPTVIVTLSYISSEAWPSATAFMAFKFVFIKIFIKA